MAKMAEIMRVEDDYMKSVASKILSEWGRSAIAREVSIGIPDLVNIIQPFKEGL